MNAESKPDSVAHAARFRTTRWSVVLRAGKDSEDGAPALEELCRAYWYPLYCFVRRKGNGPEEAKDLTQAFFARLLEKNSFALADPGRGRFRTFLATALDRFLINDWERQHREKRGGHSTAIELDGLDAEQRFAHEPATNLNPERLFERRWIETLLAKVLSRLEAESKADGQGSRFEALQVYLVEDRGAVGFAEMADRLGTTEAAVKGVVRRMRARYRELMREEVAQTVADPSDVDSEIRHLLSTFDG